MSKEVLTELYNRQAKIIYRYLLRHGEIFDDDKLNMAIKKGKKKSTRKTVLISLLVVVAAFIVIFVANAAITFKLSNAMFDYNQSRIKLTVPNGYISKSADSMGFLVGRGDFTVTRNIGNKPVVLENRVSLFGRMNLSHLSEILILRRHRLE
jgi:hypothetical protein